jgi:hypothetical protein
MTDFDLGYEHGFNNGKSSVGVKKYPNNANYCAGFKDGDHARVYMPDFMENHYMGNNDTMPDYS